MSEDDHDCLDWNCGGACLICRRPLSRAEQIRDDDDLSDVLAILGAETPPADPPGVIPPRTTDDDASA